jgi:hypothetical protein
MTGFRDDDERLAGLLRAMAVPEPRPDFLAGARRRYLEAMEARYRREAMRALLLASFGLGVAVTVALWALDPLALIGEAALLIADLAKAADGIDVVLSQVPPLAWTSVVLASVAALLSAVSLRRVGSTVTLK